MSRLDFEKTPQQIRLNEADRNERNLGLVFEKLNHIYKNVESHIDEECMEIDVDGRCFCMSRDCEICTDNGYFIDEAAVTVLKSYRWPGSIRLDSTELRISKEAANFLDGFVNTKDGVIDQSLRYLGIFIDPDREPTFSKNGRQMMQDVTEFMNGCNIASEELAKAILCSMGLSIIPIGNTDFSSKEMTTNMLDENADEVGRLVRAMDTYYLEHPYEERAARLN